MRRWFHLRENYRSTGNILNVANDIIKHNKQRKEKNLMDEEILMVRRFVIIGLMMKKMKLVMLMEEIKTLIINGEPKSSIAVLYRTNAQSRNMEEALLRENIPYKVVGSFYFYNRKEIKDLISYLKLIYNPNDDVSLMRVINVPKRQIGPKTIENLASKALEKGVSLYEAIDGGKGT